MEDCSRFFGGLDLNMVLKWLAFQPCTLGLFQSDHAFVCRCPFQDQKNIVKHDPMMLGGDLYFLWKPKKGAKVARELFWQTLVWWISSQVLLAIKWEADRPAEHYSFAC